MGRMGAIEKRVVNSPGHGRRVSRHAARLLEWAGARPGQRYLDVGCGTGAAAVHLATTYRLDVTGVDADPAQIRLARSESAGLADIRFLTGDATRLPFPDGEFDIVATNKVTHHVPRWEDALAEMRRVLAPGGVFVYADLVYPAWLAAVGRRLAGGRAGFPTAPAVEAFIARRGLVPVHVSRSWGHYETVCRLPAGRPVAV